MGTPATQFVSLTANDPQALAVQNAIALQRQQQLASMLSEQANTPVTSSSPTAPLSPLQGLSKMLQGYEAGKARDKATQLQMQGVMQQNALLDHMFGNDGTQQAPQTTGTQPPAAAPPTPAAPPSQDASDVAAGQALTGPPQNTAATLSNALAAPPASSQGPTSQVTNVPAAPQAGGSRLPSLTGDSQRDELIARQVGLPKYLEMASAQFAPTDQAKNDARVGITPAMRKQMDVRESLKNLMLPNAPGIINADTQGNPVYQELPGLAPSQAAAAGGKTAAEQQNTPKWIEDPQHPGQGRFIYPQPNPAMVAPQQAPAGSAAGMGTGAPSPVAPAGTAPPASVAPPQNSGPALRPAGAPPPPNKTGAPQVIPPVAGAFDASDLEGMKAGAQEGIKYSAKLSDDANSALQGKRTLGEMQNLLQNFTPGSFAPVLSQLGSVAESAGVAPELVKGLTGINPGDAQAFQKGTAALAAESAKQMTNRITQQEFKVYLQNNPNWMMQPDGIKRVMDYMGKGFDQTLDKQQAFAQYSQTAKPNRWPIDFEAQWNQQQREAIKRGDTNSVPAPLTGIRTAADVAHGAPQNGPAQFHEGQTASNPQTGEKFVFQGGKWSLVPPQQAQAPQQ